MQVLVIQNNIFSELKSAVFFRIIPTKFIVSRTSRISFLRIELQFRCINENAVNYIVTRVILNGFINLKS